MLIKFKSDPGVMDLYTEGFPHYATPGSAGFDLRAAEDAVIEPGGVKAVGTGLYFEMPKFVEVQIRSRSGLALNKQVFVLNSPGTIDSDYRGEIKVILQNLSPEPFKVSKGDRIAQAVVGILPPRAKLMEVEELGESRRGSGGFGSTGET